MKDMHNEELAPPEGRRLAGPPLAVATTTATRASTTINKQEAAPLANLLAFHRSIRAALAVFDETASLASAGLVDVIKTSALFDFFQGPMQWHDEDESKSLLPRLLRARVGLKPAIDACAADHNKMDAAVTAVLFHLREVSIAGAEPDAALLRCTAWELRRVLEPHLQREETQIFPAAFELFSPGDLEEMTLEMQARRMRRWAQNQARGAADPDRR